MKEGKYIYVVKGSAIVAVVRIDNVENPSKKETVQRFVLSEKKPSILFVPPEHANGFRPLEKDTKIIFFSTNTLAESKRDDYRYPADYWGIEVWEVENR
jgi:dTDP-4-dehydrorhamnose 3,5-epimerase